MKNGIVKINSDFAKKIDFTSKYFTNDSYLWLDDKTIYISLIMSKKPNKGYFSKLLNNIWKLGYKIKIPSPLGLMQFIVIKKGFKQSYENGCEIWSK